MSRFEEYKQKQFWNRCDFLLKMARKDKRWPKTWDSVFRKVGLNPKIGMMATDFLITEASSKNERESGKAQAELFKLLTCIGFHLGLQEVKRPKSKSK